ncbi:MAG TPA: NAD(P)-dependent oxidoreductase [Clostridiaceae bacterium]|nr:NAD(P)-dependent oxidoreductase [Clostridiaceae bacterium]
MKIGFIGLGKMGSGVCSNLIKNGYDTTVYDISDEAMKRFDGKARLANSDVELFKMCDVTFLSLPGYPEVEEMTDKFLSVGVKGKAVIDLSTSTPMSSKAIHAKFKAAGGDYLDAPLTGTPVHAAEGKLAVNVGGDKEDFDKYKSIIDCFARATNYIGSAGAGNVVKLVNNYIGILTSAICAEAFTLVEKMGYDVERVFTIIQDSSVDSLAYRNAVSNMCIKKSFNHGFTVNFCLKDLSYFKMLFEEIKAPSFVLDGALNVYKLARIMGLGDKGATEVVKVAYRNVGIDIE